MAAKLILKTPLEASSYQHPDRDGPYARLRKTTIQAMTERGIEYDTLAEHTISWAEDQDPFGHVMAQAYPHVSAKCFVRLLESFQEQLKDKFNDFMAATGIGAMTNRYTLAIKRVVKYPDTLISGIRIAEVRADRIQVIYSIWSVQQNTQVAELQAWIVFFNHKIGKKVDLKQEGGVWKDLHEALSRRSARCNQALKVWEEKHQRAKL